MFKLHFSYELVNIWSKGLIIILSIMWIYIVGASIVSTTYRANDPSKVDMSTMVFNFTHTWWGDD